MSSQYNLEVVLHVQEIEDQSNLKKYFYLCDTTLICYLTIVN